MTTPQLLILGCGFLGARVAALALAQGQKVIGSVRDAARVEALRAIGVDVECSAAIDPVWFVANVHAGTHVLVTYPPDAQSDPLLAKLAAERNARVVYISSTAVYGAVRGRVDHNTQAHPDEPDRKSVV